MATFSNIIVTQNNKIQTGIEINSVARRIKKAYIGDKNNIARLFFEYIDLKDFEYTRNNDGTYTLTAWKGTLNGKPSKELIVPDNKKIIL